MLQTGAFFGSLGVGPVADKIGQRWCLIGGGIIFVVGSLIQVVAAPHIPVMMVGRAIGGFGVGACSTLAPLYTSENVPAAIRGRLTACYQLFIQVGLMISFWINYAMSINYPAVPGQWQVSLALQMLPGVILVVGMLLLHESPRHLYRKGREADAIRVLAWTRSLPADHPYVAQEIQDIQLNLANEGMLADSINNNSHWALWKEIFTIKTNRNRFALGVTLMVLQQMMGVNAINYCELHSWLKLHTVSLTCPDSPQIFQNLGLKGTNNSLFATGIYGVVKVASSLTFALFLADTLGRRKSLIWTGIEQAACLFYVGAFVYIAKPASNPNVPPAGYVALVCIFLYIIGFEAGWGPVPWIYNSEIHSARLRGVCMGAAAAMNWAFNFVVSRTTPLMLAAMGDGGYGTFFFYGSFCVMCVGFAWWFCPETKGITLEEMVSLPFLAWCG